MILITGGLGYLGVRIAEHLVILGYEVRLATSRENPVVPEKLLSCECVYIDFNDNKLIEKACGGVDVIIHLAGLDAPSSQKDPESALLVTGLGTLKLLQIAESLRIKKFIYMSTVHVYGSPLSGFIDETCLPRPLHPYAITHRLAEDYVLEAHNREKLGGTVFRLSNAVGSPCNSNGHAWKLVVNDLCRQVVVDKSMQLLSNKWLSRDFLPISSVVSTVANCLINEKSMGEIFNLSSGVSLTLSELTELISKRSKKLFGYAPNVHFKGSEGILHRNRKLIISNAKIKNIGIAIGSDISHEIDQILLNCQRWF
jgi:UDP-glucose 4-epimerase